MSEMSLGVGMLVLYKNRAARVTEIGKKKLSIEDDSGQTVSIRPKDVTVLHPGPIQLDRLLVGIDGVVRLAIPF